MLNKKAGMPVKTWVAIIGGILIVVAILFIASGAFAATATAVNDAQNTDMMTVLFSVLSHQCMNLLLKLLNY